MAREDETMETELEEANTAHTLFDTETAPLLPTKSQQTGKFLPIAPWTAKNQIILFLNIALPNTFATALWEIQWIISTVVAGTRIGSDALAAIALSNLLGNLVGRSFGIGVLSAGDTLSGTAYGEKNYREIGVTAQRGALFMGVVWIFCSILWLNVEVIFSALGQPEEVSKLAGIFLRYYCMTFPAEMTGELVKSFYRCQNICLPFTYITAVIICFHCFFVERFVVAFGFAGVGLAHMATAYSFLVFCLVYAILFRSHHPGSWDGIDLFSVFSPTPLREYFSLAIPGIFSMSEWWFWEAQTVMVGTLGSSALAAHSIVYNVLPILYDIYYGFSVATQTRLSTVLAQEHYNLAPKLVNSTLTLHLVVGIVGGLAAFILKDPIVACFLGEQDKNYVAIKATTDSVWGVICSFTVLDSLLAANYGIFRGASLHFEIGIIIFIFLWCIGFPLELILVYGFSVGLLGIYSGMVAIYLMLALALFFRVRRINWISKKVV